MITPVGHRTDSAIYADAVQRHLDAVAQSKGYDNIMSACSYAGAVNPFQQESQRFVTWRGEVWGLCFKVLEDVSNGIAEKPDIDELIAALPEFGG